MKLFTSQETRKLDSLAIKEKNISSFSLMEEAALFSLNVLLENWPKTSQVIVFCGKGNNAGDGYLLAGLAKEAGITSIIVQVQDIKKLKPTSRKALDWSLSKKVQKITLASFNKLKLQKNVILVDALLGTGIKGVVKKRIYDAVKVLNIKSGKHPILSLDVPTGICSDTGIELGMAVRANVTATFLGRKRGCYTSKGRECSGKIRFSNLSVRQKVLNGIQPNCHIISMEKGLKKLTNRDTNSHKGNYGHVFVIGGDKGFGGAAILAAKAAAKSGSGLTTLVTREEHLTAALTQCPELMVISVESGQDVEPHLNRASVIVIGPGLGRSAWSEQMLQRTFWESNRRKIPVVLDADALNLLSDLKLDSTKPKKIILTPHPGEAARLLNKTVDEIESDRFKSVMELQKKYNALCVLKGSGSLVCSSRYRRQYVGVCESGNPGMASGGMGDLLSGLIGSFLAQGLSVVQAVETAVDIHSKAADMAALELGELSILASDVLEDIQYLLRP